MFLFQETRRKNKLSTLKQLFDHLKQQEHRMSISNVQGDHEGKGRDAGSRISHLAKRIFLGDFSSHKKKNHEKMNFYLLKRAKSMIFCEKKRDSLLTFHSEKWFKKNFIFSWVKGNFFWGISLFACEKKRDCLFIFLFNDHSANVVIVINQV